MDNKFRQIWTTYKIGRGNKIVRSKKKTRGNLLISSFQSGIEGASHELVTEPNGWEKAHNSNFRGQGVDISRQSYTYIVHNSLQCCGKGFFIFEIKYVKLFSCVFIYLYKEN